jgi:plastocyanin
MNTFKLILSIILFFSGSAFSQTVIKVVDQNNSPLPNAVIEYSLANSIVEKTNTEHIYVMDQINKSFEPSVLIVPENSLVSFPNSDDIRHHVYSFSPAKTFELKLYAGKPKSPVLFEQSGVVVMGCNIHDSMVGYIYVSTKENTYLSDENGEVILANNLPLNTELQVWHPNNKIGVSKHTLFTIDQLMTKTDEIKLVLTVDIPKPRGTFDELVFHEH